MYLECGGHMSLLHKGSIPVSISQRSVACLKNACACVAGCFILKLNKCINVLNVPLSFKKDELLINMNLKTRNVVSLYIIFTTFHK